MHLNTMKLLKIDAGDSHTHEIHENDPESKNSSNENRWNSLELNEIQLNLMLRTVQSNESM